MGSYTDNPGKHIDTFQHITLAFDLTWKNITVIFNQTLSDPEHATVLKEARSYAMLGFPCGSAGREFTCNARDMGLIPRLGRSPGEGNDKPLQYSYLENPMDRGAWQATVHGVEKSWTQLNI